eukprot:CAMPEP_0197240746 /NCGR_PEP_ID=MMETSP1429-20130617/6961_1 /TAXON_ID=49237 /ORGANISM="Chaetoceros  sp., Strain UNC1202" /LENGTH=264 /DNA_ID=CAMNT_0042700451 /DNA_START=123 /DNA_END=917 /DNA_ORIENTATION=-
MAEANDNRYFYHCTVNVVDIIKSNNLATQRSMGFKNISLFCEEDDGFRETTKYYQQPDARNVTRKLGQEVYPINAAFCFEREAMITDVNVKFATMSERAQEVIRGKLRGGERVFERATKGDAEWLYPRSINLKEGETSLFSGIRIPTGIDSNGRKTDGIDPEGSLVKLIALLCFYDRGDIQVAYKNKEFIDASTYFKRDTFKPIVELVERKKNKYWNEPLDEVKPRKCPFPWRSGKKKYSEKDVWEQIAKSKTTKKVTLEVTET